MKHLHLVYLIFFCLLASCANNNLTKVRYFQNLEHDLTRINQTYSNDSDPQKHLHTGGTLLPKFHLGRLSNEVTLQFLPPDSLQLSYWNFTDSGMVYVQKTFKGKAKKKYLQIYLTKNSFHIPPLFGRTHVDRLRIGLAKDSSLLIMNLYENTSYILIMGGGTGYNFGATFPQKNKLNKPLPFYESAQQKWGLVSSEDTIVPPQYDYISNFRTNSAIVLQHHKYGLIAKDGSLTQAIIYDSISLKTSNKMPSYFMLRIDNKWGMSDSLGNIIIPVAYDYVGGNYGRGIEIKNNSKYGYYTKSGYIIPPIFDKYIYFNLVKSENEKLTVALVEQDNETFFIDEFGYRYDAKQITGAFNNLYFPIISTKRPLEY